MPYKDYKTKTAYQKQWRKDNPEKHRIQQRRADLKRRFGITLEQYNQMVEEAGGCMICGGSADGRWGKTGSLNVDHCHRTNKVRGVLCDSCNLGLGKFQDDPTLLVRAAEYILQNQE